jgi:hypothetical protein
MRHATRPECQGILGQAQHSCGSPPALLTRFCPLRRLPLPQAEEHPEGETISRRRGDTTKYDTAGAGLVLVASIIRAIALMMEAAITSETSVNFYQTTRRNIPDDNHLHNGHREKLKSHLGSFNIYCFMVV